MNNIWHKIKKPLIYGLTIFLIGGFGSLIVQKYLAPYLSAKPLFRHIGFLRVDTPLVITKTEQVRVNEGVRLIDLVKQLTPKVVTIVAGRGEIGKNFTETGRGSGVIISADGLVVSEANLFSDRKNKFFAVTSDSKVYPVTFLVGDPKGELVIVKIEDGTLPVADFGVSYELETAQQVVLLSGVEGSNLGALKTAYVSLAPGSESINAINSSESYRAVYGLDTSPRPGEAIFNLRGQLVGLGLNAGQVAPVEAIRSALDSYLMNKRIVRPELGINFSLINAAGSRLLGLPVEHGILLRSGGRGPAVWPGRPAALACLQEGDIILKINEQEINSRQGLDFFLSRAVPGDVWRLTILRKGVEKKLEVTLGKLE